MLCVCSRQIKLIFILLMITGGAALSIAQRGHLSSANPNFNKFQQKSFYYGIALGFNSSFFKVDQSNSFFNNPAINVVESVGVPGFSVGVIGNLKIGRYFDLRSIINYSFAGRKLTFSRAGSTVIDKERLFSSFVEIPFLLRFKSAPYRDKRVFIVTGFKYIYDASNKANVNTDDFQLNISPHDFQYEIGVGVQFFMPFFILSPEIKFSQGLGNILIYDEGNTKSNLLSRVLSRTISFSLNFEG